MNSIAKSARNIVGDVAGNNQKSHGAVVNARMMSNEMQPLRIIVDLMPTEWQRQGYLIPPRIGDEMWETVKEMRFKPPEQTDEDKQRDEMYTGSNCGDG